MESLVRMCVKNKNKLRDSYVIKTIDSQDLKI